MVICSTAKRLSVPIFMLVPALLTSVGTMAADTERTGRDIYMNSCVICHGEDGRGTSQSLVGFDIPLPDFTDCSFASREPDGDWNAVVHAGGPVRGFSEMMPAFGGLLTLDEVQRVTDYLRTFCGDDAWPHGNLNLPRPLITEKAYPEDEAVFTTTVLAEGPEERIEGEVVFEQRFGAHNQFELVVPFGWHQRQGEEDWGSSIGDIAVGIKRAFWHSLEKGSIFSATFEVILPTGDESDGFGKGTTVFEPFISYGQILPVDFFLHGQAGVELPFDTEKADEEAFLRAAVGRSFSTGGMWGRTWSPMVEFLGGRELVSGAESNWDIVPQIQITLNTRQHIMLNVGVRTPLNNDEGRYTRAMVYLLWDWFDGSLFEGW